MKKTISLSNPIKIDGKTVKELTYDTNEITAELFAEAEAMKQKAGRANGNRSGAMELDYPLHLYLGIAAVVAVNPDYSFEDVARVRGRDLIDISVVGRNFIMKSEELPDADSDEPLETSPASITQASQKSNEND